MVKIKFDARKLKRALAQLPDKVARTALRQAVNAGAEVIRKEAQRNAPVRTGQLRRRVVKRSARKRSGPELTVRVGPDRSAPQGLWAEFGTSKQPAHPFIRPAIDTHGATAIRVIGEKLGTAIERAAARLRR